MGMPRLRQAYTPHPVVDQSAAHLRAYIDGSDAVSGRPFMQEVLDGLTSPLEDADLQGLSFERTTPRLVEPDTEDNLQRLFEENRWTDMLPIVLPTEARVEAMLKGTSHPPDKIVGRLRPTVFRESWEFTVEKVAVNAVMAGARPGVFPGHPRVGRQWHHRAIEQHDVVRDDSGHQRPDPQRDRDELGHRRDGSVQPRQRHDRTRLRSAVAESSGRVGSQRDLHGLAGQLVCVYGGHPEAEERSPWQPLHVQKGFKPTDSIASIFFGGWYTHAGYGPRATWQEKMRHALAAVEQYSPPLFVMDPIVARGFVDLGFDTKEKLIAWCADNALLTAREYWDNQSIQLLRPKAVAGIEPYASRLKAQPDEVIRIYEPSEINIVVAGGETQGAWKMISGALRATVSIDAWR